MGALTGFKSMTVLSTEEIVEAFTEAFLPKGVTAVLERRLWENTHPQETGAQTTSPTALAYRLRLTDNEGNERLMDLPWSTMFNRKDEVVRNLRTLYQFTVPKLFRQ